MMSFRPVQITAVATLLMFASAAGAADTRSKTAKVKRKATQTVKAVKQDVNEALLNSRIQLKLLESLKGADALRVSVDMRGTTAHLSGEVENRASVALAAEAARSVQGVSSVKSQVSHNPKAPHQENFDTHVKDGMLMAQVRIRLLQEVGTSAVGIHITATDGVVSLRGEVPNSTTRAAAVDNVKAISDVKRVEDMLTVTP